MSRTATRLAAGTLALLLPVAAAAGCGAQKKRTVKAELASAQTNLENSKAASFTLRFEDTKGTVAKLIEDDEDAPDEELVDALMGASITYVVDPASDKRLRDVQVAGTSTDDLDEQLEDVNFAFVVRDDKAALLEVRAVAGVLYVRVDVDEIGRLAEAGGTEDFDAQVDDFVDSADEKYREGLEDAVEGKWIKLDLKDYVEQFQDLAESFTGTQPQADSDFDPKQTGQDVFAAIKPFIKVTDAGDDADERVLDVDVQARPALKAALKVLQADEKSPFAAFIGEVAPADIDDAVADGTAHGTITLKNGHLTQFAVDVESIRLLSTDPGDDSVEGALVVVDVDDSADAVKAPTDVSGFDVGALLEEFLDGFSPESFDESGSYSG